MHKYVRCALICALTALAAACAAGATRTNPSAAISYTAYIANEASDVISRVVFTPGTGVAVRREVHIGMPGRIVGAHGLAVSPDGRSWFVALSHGTPGGRIAKYGIDADTLISRVGVGAFPSTVTVTPDGQYLFIANSNLHESDDISGISIVNAQTMTEVARPNTCLRPQGGRFNASATKHYSVCESSDQVVEIDTHTFRVTHRLSVVPGRERVLDPEARGGARRSAPAVCAPAAVATGRGSHPSSLYVACAGTREIVEIDAVSGQVARRIPAGGDPYDIVASPDGSVLIATVHSDSSVLLIDAATGNVRARIATSQTSPHGVAVSGDGRYAFITNEGGGTNRGTIDVIDLASLTRVASATLAYAPGGIDVMSQH